MQRAPGLPCSLKGREILATTRAQRAVRPQNHIQLSLPARHDWAIAHGSRYPIAADAELISNDAQVRSDRSDNPRTIEMDGDGSRRPFAIALGGATKLNDVMTDVGWNTLPLHKFATRHLDHATAMS